MGAVGHSLAVFTTFIALCGAIFSCWVSCQKESVTMQDASAPLIVATTAGAAFISSMVQLIAYLVYYRDDLKAWREERRKQMGDHLHHTLRRIQKEKENFVKIKERKPTQGTH